jgi:hypothetical protein
VISEFICPLPPVDGRASKQEHRYGWPTQARFTIERLSRVGKHTCFSVQEYERSSSVARGLQGARRRGRAGRWQTERFSGAALPSNAPGAGRSKAEARAHAPAAAQTTKNRPLCMATENIFFEPTRNLRRPYDLLCERRSMPRCERFSGSGHTSPPLRPPFPTPLATGVRIRLRLFRYLCCFD